MGKFRPVIGVAADTDTCQPAENGKYFIKKALLDAITDSGCVPLAIPPVSAKTHDSPDAVREYARSAISRVDALLISGGAFDIDPKKYGEELHPRCGRIEPCRTDTELALLDSALKDRPGMPVLGICGGHQLINVAFGGTLYQDIPSQTDGTLPHAQKKPNYEYCHEIEVEPGTLVHEILFDGQKAQKSQTIRVNSTHHQAVKKPGAGLKVSAVSVEKSGVSGIVEALEPESAGVAGGGFLLGIQWHPEYLANRPDKYARRVFDRFRAEAEKFAGKK